MHPSKERIGRNLDELFEMSDEMKNARNEILPSKYWEYLNKTIEGKINLYGFENFKRTYAVHYFTFYLSPFSNKIKNLSSDLPLTVKIKLLSKIFKKHSILGWRRSLSYNMLTIMLWEYVKRREPGICKALEEPLIGNPPKVYDEGKLISEDLANSILEFISVKEGLPAIKRDSMTVTELGSGYGDSFRVSQTESENKVYCGRPTIVPMDCAKLPFPSFIG
jgi:hypothetical protein